MDAQNNDMASLPRTATISMTGSVRAAKIHLALKTWVSWAVGIALLWLVLLVLFGVLTAHA